MTTSDVRASADAEFARILDERDVQTVFQPIVHLPTREVVGYEALVRGPKGSELASAGALLAAAKHAGRVVEFDWVARASACRAAMEAGLETSHLLFLNIEPIALDSECPDDLCADIARAFNSFRVVLEVTERSLDRDPGTLLDGIERQRLAVAGIALDDVGSSPATLSMLPLIAPSVIKIDRCVVQAAPADEVARVLNAVEEEAERASAIILAEGVETAEHSRRALAYGAQLGQGNVLGTAGPLPARSQRPGHMVALHRSAPFMVASPFDALAGQTGGTTEDDLVNVLMQHVASCAEGSAPALVVNLLPGQHVLERDELRRLAELSTKGTFAAVLGPEVPADPGEGVRGTGQRPVSPPTDQWAAIALGPCINAAVLARRVPGGDGAWMYGLTHDRSRVVAAARSLVRLLGPPTR